MDISKNFATAVVSTGYDAAATSIVLVTGGGARLPAATSGDATTHFNAVWWNATDYPNPADDPGVEIVRVTNVVGDTLTIARAQESTGAGNHNTSGKVYKVLSGMTLRTWDQVRAVVNLVNSGGTRTRINLTTGNLQVKVGANWHDFIGYEDNGIPIATLHETPDNS